MEEEKKSYLLIDDEKKAYYTMLIAGIMSVFSASLLFPFRSKIN